MNTEQIFTTVAEVLRSDFKVEAVQISPDTALSALGLDSLALMEFVFAVEDEFRLRIPEERLDPRQSSLTLADLCKAIAEHLEQPHAQEMKVA